MIDSVLEQGFSFLKFIEAHRNPFLDQIFLFFHYFGREHGYLIVAPIIYWFNANNRGLKVLLGLLFCWYVNIWLKIIIAEPRPFAYGPLANMVSAGDFSFPSGHAQLSAFFWTAVYFLRPSRSLLWASSAFVVLTGLCRLYLGVHFPHDVLIGWILGIALAFFICKSRAVDWFFQKPRIYWSIVPIIMFVLFPSNAVLSPCALFLGITLGHRDYSLRVLRPAQLALVILASLAVEIMIYILIPRTGFLPDQPLQEYAITAAGFFVLGFWISHGPYALLWKTRRKS